MINDTTINKLDEAINLVDNVTYETSIQEKGIESFKLYFIHTILFSYINMHSFIL